MAGTGNSSTPSSSKSQEVISLMELLADRAPHAHHCCAIIIHCFKIALVSEMVLAARGACCKVVLSIEGA